MHRDRVNLIATAVRQIIPCSNFEYFLAMHGCLMVLADCTNFYLGFPLYIFLIIWFNFLKNHFLGLLQLGLSILNQNRNTFDSEVRKWSKYQPTASLFPIFWAVTTLEGESLIRRMFFPLMGNSVFTHISFSELHSLKQVSLAQHSGGFKGCNRESAKESREQNIGCCCFLC